MTPAQTLSAGRWTLYLAQVEDREAVEALQRAAYAPNKVLLGVEPLPLLAHYADVLARYEVWLAGDRNHLLGALILEPGADDLLVWSVATHPDGQRTGLGRALLMAAEERARALGIRVLRLYTGATLDHLIAWYGRHGYALERVEELADRRIAHMVKRLS